MLCPQEEASGADRANEARPLRIPSSREDVDQEQPSEMSIASRDLWLLLAAPSPHSFLALLDDDGGDKSVDDEEGTLGVAAFAADQ